MNVLVITGDRRFGAGNPRYELQKSAVERFEVLYWGRGSVRPALPKGAFDAVTAQDSFFRGLFGWYAARRLGARFNVQVHADLYAQPFIKRIIAQVVLRHADSVRAVSEKIQAQVLRIAPRAKVTVLPVFVELDRFRNLSRTPDGKTILWAGRFEPEKDPLLALEVIKHIPDAKLVMLGKGSMEAMLKEKAKGLPVEFPGWKDPAEYLPKAGVALCTSRAESWGAGIVEALAAGVPVVAPDVGVAKEAGAIVAPREKLAEKVIEVLKNATRGELKLHLPDAQEWATKWRETLL